MRKAAEKPVNKWKNPLAKMDRVELMEMLEQLTRENTELQRSLQKMKEAHAEQVLQGHELTQALEETQARNQQLETELKELKAQDHDAVKQPEQPIGSFAEAMVQAQEIVQRTQEAADKYLAACAAEVEKAKEKAKDVIAQAGEDAGRIIAQAQKQAEEMLQQAQERKLALERKEAMIRQRIRTETDGLNQMMDKMERDNA